MSKRLFRTTETARACARQVFPLMFASQPRLSDDRLCGSQSDSAVQPPSPMAIAPGTTLGPSFDKSGDVRVPSTRE